ncbi:MAG: glycerate kinase [Clostridia bacterium]|nr:glycerate kinase [Clostridia bacterium]
MISVLIAPDSFKGTLSAAEVCDIAERAFKDTIKDVEIIKLPAADGGEGLCACFEGFAKGKRISASVSGVFGEKMTAEYFMLENSVAVVEMASCAGLVLAGDNKDPERATTLGVGELMLHAKENGAKSILLGLGGSATNDCGIGMATALGWRFLDENGNTVAPCGKSLSEIKKIIPPEKPFDLPVTAACDVENPLYGETGAAYVFAPQKGADEAAVIRLDSGLRSFAEIIRRDVGKDASLEKGAGAAGGMGAGAIAFINATLKKGIDIILDESGFDSIAKDCDLVVTGEGRLDFQSADGKVISGIAKRAKKLGKKVIAVCGCRGKGAEKILECGVSAMYFSEESEKPLAEIIPNCRENLYKAVCNAALNIKSLK